jgi:hypothetical protein
MKIKCSHRKTKNHSTTSDPSDSSDPSCPSASHRARNGKIARLPQALRDQLNQRLADGQPGPALLDWLNALPETRSLLAESFDGVPISLQNLSQWRQGGFTQWLAERNMEDHCQDLRHFAYRIEQGGPPFGYVADDLLTVLSAQYAQLVAAACGLDGGEFPQWENRLQALHPLLRDAIQLQRAVQQAADHQDALQQADQAQEAQEAANIKRGAGFVKFLDAILQKNANGQDMAQPVDRQGDPVPMDLEDPPVPAEPEAPSEGESNPIKPNQTQSNPKTSAPDQTAAAPQADSTASATSDPSDQSYTPAPAPQPSAPASAPSDPSDQSDQSDQPDPAEPPKAPETPKGDHK